MFEKSYQNSVDDHCSIENHKTIDLEIIADLHFLNLPYRNSQLHCIEFYATTQELEIKQLSTFAIIHYYVVVVLFSLI
jgi:hypothetical protein